MTRGVVMAGLVLAIDVLITDSQEKKDVDARDKRGHDAWRCRATKTGPLR
jgi:hypothetical protein